MNTYTYKSYIILDCLDEMELHPSFTTGFQSLTVICKILPVNKKQIRNNVH